MALPSLSTGSPRKYSGAQPLDRPRASEIPETLSRWGESSAEQAPAQVFPGPVLRPLPLDNGTLNEMGKLNSCLSPSEWEAGALLTAPQGDCRLAEEGHCPGPSTRQLPRVFIMFRCTGDKVSKDHGKIRMFSEVCVPPGKPVIITDCSWPSKPFRHEVPQRERLVSCISMDPLLSHAARTPRSSHLRSVHAASHLPHSHPHWYPHFLLSSSSHHFPLFFTSLHTSGLWQLCRFSAKLPVSDPIPDCGYQIQLVDAQ